MTRIAALHSDEASIVVESDPARGLMWRHCGAHVDPGELTPLADTRGPATFSLDEDIGQPVSPASGLGWFGPPAFRTLSMAGSPQTFAPTDIEVEASSSSLVLFSQDAGTGVAHRLRIDALDAGAFAFNASLHNEGSEPLHLAALASAHIPLPANCGSILSWRGRHNAELVECREPMPAQRWERVGRRGISGHGGPPGIYILGQETGWDSGLAFALQLGWSGDSRLAVERDDEGYWHLCADATLAPGEIVLQPGETWHAPPAYLAISTRGRNGAMAQQHAAMRTVLQWPGGTMRPRPVHLNSWEACYFDHDADRIEELASAGAAIGVERFVLDGGWFAGRRDDGSGLGDWCPDPITYPDGLAPLAHKTNDAGMEFGVWVEPEMVSPDSDLYRAHPDWVLGPSGRAGPTARNQLVLDLRREEVRDYLLEKLDSLLASAPIAYLKWDHNRDHAPGGGAAQTRGAYALLARLRDAHPGVEIEGCAGGGGRSDAGMLAHVHRFWTSDNIDAVSRVAMQRGFLAFLPPETMGSHVGASPSHATGRTQSIAFRAAVACMGHMGVELDPRTLDESDRSELARWIDFHKEWRHLLHANRTWLGEGVDGLLWQACGTPERMLLFCIRTAPPQDRRPRPLPLPFAAERPDWQVSLLARTDVADRLSATKLFERMRRQSQAFSGSWLANAGLPLPPQQAESVAIFLLESSE